MKQLLAANRRERKANEPFDVEDKVAECSGDEQGETVSINGDPVDVTAECSGDEQVEKAIRNGDKMDTAKTDEQNVVARNGLCESDESDDELRDLIKKKKRLEMEKETLSDAKQRRRAEREKLKSKLKTDVKTLETEVAELNLKYK
ncbi:uncharacterized protein LOC128556855 [Mercenaria mercenaria]|uniref:uncharacterized protein LOC128556855 n=1 Tax=Mercenaria mercenaria TaxID=6596 RepID=UPI00234EA8B5|nr:uncharacterized protein LOC128556855 [Mercenaria mercenaria]